MVKKNEERAPKSDEEVSDELKPNHTAKVHIEGEAEKPRKYTYAEGRP